MDITRMKQLAGMQVALVEYDQKVLTLLNEVVHLPDDISMDQLIQRLDACKRAMAIVNKMTDPADKKKWMSATFVNLNKVRGALQRMMKQLDGGATPAVQAPVSPAAQPSPASGDGKFMIGSERI